MNPVVIIEERECTELTVFHSIEVAAGHLEAIDVENREFEAFDSEGFPLTLSVDGRRVKIERTSGAAPKKKEVEAKLRRYVGDAGASMTFDELIAAAERRSRGWLTDFISFFGKKKEPNQ
jgi:hypothetical protein